MVSEASKDGTLTTAQLLQRLARRGLSVTTAMLGADVHDHYLPKPEIVGGGPGGGTHGEWPFWALERATRLYQLRRRGVQGMTLRLLLFIRDGWGWSYVKPAVLDAFRKGIRATQTGLRETLHKPQSPADVQHALDDAAEAQRKRIIAHLGESEASEMRVNPETMAFIWGLGLYGTPLQGGSLRSLTPMFKALNPTWSDEAVEEGRALVEQTFAAEHLTFEKQLMIVNEIDDVTAQAAIPAAKEHIRAWRAVVHRAARDEGRPGHSTNLFTFCGKWKEASDSDFWSGLPQRMTPTQMLAAFVGTMVSGDVLFNRSFAGQIFNVLEAIIDRASKEPEEN
jgi:hypothetical protein